MIKCNVTVCGTICRVATVRTNNGGKIFTSFAINCVVPAQSGINKTVEISVAKDGEDNELKNCAIGQRVNVSGTLIFKKRGDNLYFNLSASEVTLSASNEDTIKGEMLFRGKTGKNIEEKTDKKGKDFLQFSGFSAEKVNDGFDCKREEWLQPQTGIEVKGDMELFVYNDKLNLSCKIAEMSAYVKPPYNPNN